MRLPLNVHVVVHPKEPINRSTSLHVRILAPEQSALFLFPAQIPAYDPAKTLLLFPGPDAWLLDADLPVPHSTSAIEAGVSTVGLPAPQRLLDPSAVRAKSPPRQGPSPNWSPAQVDTLVVVEAPWDKVSAGVSEYAREIACVWVIECVYFVL